MCCGGLVCPEFWKTCSTCPMAHCSLCVWLSRSNDLSPKIPAGQLPGCGLRQTIWPRDPRWAQSWSRLRCFRTAEQRRVLHCCQLSAEVVSSLFAFRGLCFSSFFIVVILHLDLSERKWNHMDSSIAIFFIITMKANAFRVRARQDWQAPDMLLLSCNLTSYHFINAVHRHQNEV